MAALQLEFNENINVTKRYFLLLMMDHSLLPFFFFLMMKGCILKLTTRHRAVYLFFSQMSALHHFKVSCGFCGCFGVCFRTSIEIYYMLIVQKLYGLLSIDSLKKYFLKTTVINTENRELGISRDHMFYSGILFIYFSMFNSHFVKNVQGY